MFPKNTRRKTTQDFKRQYSRTIRSFILLAALAAAVSCQDEQAPTAAIQEFSGPIAQSVTASTVVLSPTADTRLGLDAINRVTDTILTVYTWPDQKIANAILMKFDPLASIPPGSVISSATLNLNLTSTDASSDPTYTVTVHEIINKNPDLTRATGYTYDGVNSWTSNACCYNNIPLAQADIGPAVDTKAIDKALGFKQWDVTSIVQEWVNSPSTNFGLLLNSDASKLADRWRYFSSSEYPTPGNRPYMTVVYTPPSWPNQPAGMTTLSDQPWDALGTWQLNDNSSSYTSLVTKSGLPFSPSGALQDFYPTGLVGGCAGACTGRADFYIPTAQQPTEIYVGLWAALSNPFQPHGSGVQKIMYLHDNNGINFSALWLEIYGATAPFGASLVNQFVGCPSIRIDPNVNQTPISPGEWHRYELYLKLASTSSSSDGVLQVWVDGVLNVSRTDVCTLGSNAHKVESVRLSGMWGGAGDAKTENDYLWYDHTFVSGR